MFRIYRNSSAYFSQCSDLNDTEEHYPDAWFENLRDNGFNAFWINIWMRRLVAFRENESPEQLKNQDIVKRLIEKAAKYDLELFLLLNEPKAFARTNRIWERFPDMKGGPGTWPRPPIETYLLCTSSQEGKAYVYENAERLHRCLPDLGGTVHINASESPTHCYCHTIRNPGGIIFSGKQEHDRIDCPRCAERTPEEVIAEILNLYHAGCRAAGSKAPVIAWNWDWAMYSPDPQEGIISRLDPDIQMMADFEIGGHMQMRWKERPVNEYSLIYVGPSTRYLSIKECAERYGHTHSTKLQLGTTHELASIVNMPLVGNIYEKFSILEENGCRGFLGTWNFGCRFCMNTGAVNLFYSQKKNFSDRASFLEELASLYFNSPDGESFRDAVNSFEKSFLCYPLSNEMLYFGPINYALALPLDGRPLTGKPPSSSWLNQERGDAWDQCIGEYTCEEVIAGFEEMGSIFRKGMEAFEKMLFPSGSPHETLKDYRGGHAIRHCSDRLTDDERVADMRNALGPEITERIPELSDGIYGVRRLEEWSNGWALLGCIDSTCRVFKNFTAKRDKRDDYANYLKKLQREELETIEQCLPLFHLDERLGLHIECRTYFITRELLQAKLDGLNLL